MNKFLPIINENKKSFLGIPVYRKIYYENFVKTYICGIKIKKINIPQKSNTAINKKSNTENVKPIGHADRWYNLDHSKLNVVIKFSGGLGDILINLNYVYLLIKKYKQPKIKFYLCGSLPILNFLIKNNENIEQIYADNDLREDSHAFDVLIKLVRFPQIKWANKKKIAEYSEEFLDYILSCERFMILHPRFFECGRTCDGQVNMLAKLYGKNRVQTPDIINILNVKDINFLLQIPQNKNLYKDYGISSSKYITIHRGNDIKNKANCVKLWPTGYYGILTKFLKEKYPEYQIVQLGVSKERCPDIENVDLNLVEKTTLDDVAFLLKHSALHIDCEGGFAHLRHAIHGGKTVVLFGPTDVSYYGYSENINLRTDVCRGCEWVREKWLESCTKGMKNPACMYSLTPEFVFSQIVKSGVLNG